jgi:hypothetical protein
VIFEHKRLGGIYTHHRSLYGRMLACPIDELPSLGLERLLSHKPEPKV